MGSTKTLNWPDRDYIIVPKIEQYPKIKDHFRIKFGIISNLKFVID